MRCEITKLTRYYVRTRSSDKTFDGQCRRIAEFKINEKNLCREHASIALLEIAKLNKTIEYCERDYKEKEYRKKPKYD